ncbi:MAG: hypothetical protein NVSMB12_19450 [Acidimicrobiales bacterium]
MTADSFERRHGEPIGFFVPVTAKDRRAGRRVLGLLEAAVEEFLTASGVTEDELVDALGRGRYHR